MSFGISDCVNEENQKNKVAVYCPLCGCKILTKEMGTYSNQPIPLPLGKNSEEYEELINYWVVANQFHFENIAVSNTVGDCKYLTCADCEQGILGVFKQTGDTNFYLSCDRVSYVESDKPRPEYNSDLLAQIASQMANSPPSENN